MGRGAKIFFLSALAAGCVFGLVSFLIIYSFSAGTPADTRKSGETEITLTVFCLDENDGLCSVVKISAGKSINVVITLPDAKTAETFCTRGYTAALEKLGASDYYAIVPQGAVAEIASKTGVTAPASLTDENEARRFSSEVAERLLKSDGDKVFGTMSEKLDTDLTPEALAQIIENRKNIK